MLKNLLKGRARSATSKQEANQSALYRALFEFLIGCVSVPAAAEQLIQLGKKAAVKDPDEVFYTYLLFENT